LRNNGVFGIEEMVMGNSDPAKIKTYDRLPLWQYHKLPEAMGCRDWFCTSVETKAELDAALKKARSLPGASYIEIQLGCEKLLPCLSPKALDRFYQTEAPATAS
jgi:TPP-dependent 2-oxoacid decarboxylase